MSEFLSSTRQTLANLLQQQRASELQEKSPQGQLVLERLMQIRKNAALQDVFRQKLISGEMTPAEIATQAAGLGNFDLLDGIQKQKFARQAATTKFEREKELIGERTAGQIKVRQTPSITKSLGSVDPKDYRFSEKGTNLTFKYITLANKFGSDFETVRNNIVNIQAATQRMLDAPDPSSFNRIATDQAVITSFNKVLDPSSVVRESEYKRTATNVALVNRARGFFEKLKAGGAGITQADIVEIRDTALEMAELRREITNAKLEKQIRIPAGKRNLDPEEIAPLFEPIAENKQAVEPTVEKSEKDRAREFLRKQNLIK